MYRNIWLQTVRLHQLPKYSIHVKSLPKRMKWHFRDSRLILKFPGGGCAWTPYEISRLWHSSALFKNLVAGHFAERHFAERHFAERHFAERTFS